MSYSHSEQLQEPDNGYSWISLPDSETSGAITFIRQSAYASSADSISGPESIVSVAQEPSQSMSPSPQQAIAHEEDILIYLQRSSAPPSPSLSHAELPTEPLNVATTDKDEQGTSP